MLAYQHKPIFVSSQAQQIAYVFAERRKFKLISAFLICKLIFFIKVTAETSQKPILSWNVKSD